MERIGKNNQWTKEFSFESAFQGDFGFKFLTFGDWDTNENSVSTLNNLLSKKGHQFIIHQGDLPYAWSEEKWDTFEFIFFLKTDTVGEEWLNR
jgi:hypothetical protein